MGGSGSAVLRPTLTASTSTGLGAGWVCPGTTSTSVTVAWAASARSMLGAGWVCPGTTSTSVTSAWAASAGSTHAGAVAEILGVDEAELDEAAGGHAQSG